MPTASLQYDADNVAAFSNQHLSARLPFVPPLAGVYLMRDQGGRVIYVGKAKNLRRRLRDYFGVTLHKDPKVRALVESVVDFEIHTTETERDALLLEERLIGDFLPRFNVSLRYGRRRYWIVTDLDASMPRLEVTTVKPGIDAKLQALGPYPSHAAACWLVRWVNRTYGLRSCTPVSPGSAHFAHCQEHIVNRCAAPCVGRISQDAYRGQMHKAVQWLAQPRWRLVRILKEQMRLLAGARQFEKAAQYRDMISFLAETGSALPPRGLKVDPGLGQAQQDALKTLMGLKVLETIECFDISHSGGLETVASLVRFNKGLPEKSGYRYYCLAVTGPNDFASMREAVARRYKCGLPPDLVVVDGGLPQLAAAAEALAEVKCLVPLIALAKEEERIFFTDGGSLKLPNASPALHLVQRIRDEAHRRANGYTRRRRSKKMSASILETVPGLGEDLRRSVLRNFGSVARLRKASLGSILQVPGIGVRMAKKIIFALRESLP